MTWSPSLTLRWLLVPHWSGRFVGESLKLSSRVIVMQVAVVTLTTEANAVGPASSATSRLSVSIQRPPARSVSQLFNKSLGIAPGSETASKRQKNMEREIDARAENANAGSSSGSSMEQAASSLSMPVQPVHSGFGAVDTVATATPTPMEAGGSRVHCLL